MVKENNKKKKYKHKNKRKLANDDEIEHNSEDIDESCKKEPEPEEYHENPKESAKREINDDSEDEGKPKKKKKKVFADQPDGEKKGKKSIRQMKREKHAQRQAQAQAEAKDHLMTQCLSYLSQWKHDKQNWKFMKAKQVWLYKNKFSAKLLPDASWPLFLEYFESAKGNIRNLLLEDANKIIKQMDEWIEHNGKDNMENKDDEENVDAEAPEGPRKPDETSYKRARDLIQCLEE